MILDLLKEYNLPSLRNNILSSSDWKRLPGNSSENDQRRAVDVTENYSRELQALSEREAPSARTVLQRTSSNIRAIF